MKAHNATQQRAAWEVRTGKKVSENTAILLGLLELHGPMTRQMLSTVSTLPINVVCARMNECIHAKHVTVQGTAPNPTSGKDVQVLGLREGV